MTKIITSLSAVIIIIFNTSFSQKLDHDRTSPWFFGLNAGGTWHNTDVKNKTHYGWGIVLGRTFNRDYANLFSYDLKFRYLGGAWRGQNTDTTGFHDYTNLTLSQVPTDYKNTYGYSINNFQTKAHEFNLELSIHLNRLTERTGIDPYIFGGIGATFFRATGNLTDDMGFMYNYSLLSDYSKTSLKNFMDQSYETFLDGSQNRVNGKFMGHLGFGLGYYFTRNVALGFEHKTSFTGGDIFDGVVNDHGKYKQDIYHYTSLYLKVYFNRARINQGYTPQPQPAPSTPATPANPQVNCPDPDIRLNTAVNSTVSQPVFQINGRIQSTSLQGITSIHNGIQTGDFVYSNQGNFRGTYHLQPGLNTIILSAANNCGNTTETIYVNYVPACDNPVVNFINPRTANTSTTASSIPIQAQITHLGDGLIQLYANGQQTTNFNYNNGTGALTSNVALQNGNNTVQIIVSNNCGTNSQTIYVEYSRHCPVPLIAITSPTTNYGTSGRVEVTAAIQNISNANQVDVYVNGGKQTTGTYHTGTSVYKKTLNLSPGQNTIVIRATNSCGTSEQSIVYEYGQPCLDPTVTITNPSGPRASTTTSTYTVQAAIQNVVNPQNILFKVNNTVITSFNYSIQTGLFTANIQLSSGSNSIELSVSNECGYASASSTISYTPPCIKPAASWRQPEANTTVSSEDYTLEAIISNISSAHDVTLLLNGALQTAGTYFSNTTIYSKPLKLQRGNNLIQLTASNHCGETTITINVYFKGESVVVGNKPTVVFTNDCGIKTTAGRIKFTGNVFGVSETSQIQVKLQNTIQNGVVFNRIGNGFSFELEVRAGYSQTYTAEVTATNILGTTAQRCQVITEDAPVVDKDIVICHTINRVKQTITIKESQWPQYQRLGATLGECPVVVADNDMVICYTQKGQKVTLTIKESQWPLYQKSGATQGPCPEAVDNDITVCVPKGREKITMTIKESQWAHYQQMGATLGECPEVIDNDIIICVPEGRTKVTMTIKESQWPQYSQLGATLGECPVYDPEIVICLREGALLNTLTIKQSEWPEYQAKGAFLGACPEIVDADITICLPDEQGNKITLTIKQSQWTDYQSKGAVLGACKTEPSTNDETPTDGTATPVSGKMLICVEENGVLVTKTISTSEWRKYERLGAVRGACVDKTQPSQDNIKDTQRTQPGTIGRSREIQTTQPVNNSGRITRP